MRNCPSDFDLAAFIDGALDETEAVAIRQHVAHCSECSHALMDVVSLQDRESVDLLQPLSLKEAEQIATAVRKSRGQANTEQCPNTKLSERIRGVFGVAAGVSILSELGKGVVGSHLIPAFGVLEENNLDHSVRNDEISHSKHHAGDDLATHDVNNQIHHMTSEQPPVMIENAPTVIGLPEYVQDNPDPHIKQTYSDTCAVRSQELVLRDFGIQISEDDLRHEAAINGWYSDGGGTSMEHVGDLMELHGVPIHKYADANIFTLTSELAQGHKVIIGVNSGELWAPGILHDLGHSLGLNGADHALIVSGIDTSDPDHVNVVLTDPGSGDVAKSYPMEQFIQAWKDSHCFMVATTQPAPAWLPEMAHFDYGEGHIASIGQLPYDQFITSYGHEADGSVPLDASHDLLHNFKQAVSGELHQIEHSWQRTLGFGTAEDEKHDHPDNWHPHPDEPTIEEVIHQHEHSNDDETGHLRLEDPKTEHFSDNSDDSRFTELGLSHDDFMTSPPDYFGSEFSTEADSHDVDPIDDSDHMHSHH